MTQAAHNHNGRYSSTLPRQSPFVSPDVAPTNLHSSIDVQPLRSQAKTTRPMSAVDSTASSSQTPEFGKRVEATSSMTLGRDASLVKNGDKDIKKKHTFFGGNLFSKSKKEKEKDKKK